MVKDYLSINFIARMAIYCLNDQQGAPIISFLNILCMGEIFLNFVIIIVKDVSFNYTLLQGWSFTAEMVQQMAVRTMLLKQICIT